MIGGALSPDGSRIVAAVENGGRTNLFLLERSGEEIRQLTDGGAINVNPAFSADGQQLAFTSDRSGTPQVYVMSLGGGPARRVTFQGDVQYLAVVLARRQMARLSEPLGRV